MDVVVRPRQGGKTTEAVEWVLAGERSAGYPGWTRVLVVPNLQHFDAIRKQWWDRVEDFDHRIYTLRDWQNAVRVRPGTEVALDNAEWMLPTLPGSVTMMTVTGTARA